jgi:hypothetical protein
MSQALSIKKDGFRSVVAGPVWFSYLRGRIADSDEWQMAGCSELLRLDEASG